MGKLSTTEVKTNIRGYIEKNLIKFDETDFADSDNIFAMGFVNSLFAMKLLNFIENQYAIEIDDDEIEIRNFSSIDNIINLISKKKEILA